MSKLNRKIKKRMDNFGERIKKNKNYKTQVYG